MADQTETPDEKRIAFEAGLLSFAQWMGLVDAEIAKITDIIFSNEDFADFAYAEAFEDGVEPRQAAIDALAADVVGASFIRLAGL